MLGVRCVAHSWQVETENELGQYYAECDRRDVWEALDE
jgi:hypothetical protein